MRKQVFKVLFILTLTFYAAVGQYLDEPCRIRGRGRRSRPQRGVCSYIEDCPVVERQLLNGIYPEICSFEGYDAIICCPQQFQNTGTTKPSPPPSPSPVHQTLGSRSIAKCQEYLKTSEKLSDGPTIFTAVVGGTAAKGAEFPHMAALGFGNENDVQWQCGGTLISEQFVLTAGHCLYSSEYGDVSYVRLGDLNLKARNDDAQPQDFRVSAIFRNPGYRPPSVYNDIGLIKLDRPASLTKYVMPACLQVDRNLPTLNPIATGWGRLGFTGETSDTLMKVNLAYYDTQKCRQSFKNVPAQSLPNGINEELQICAGGPPNEIKDTCQGDSGGPLQLLTNGFPYQYHIVGVTSFGKACGVQNIPGVYTRVSNYLSWIEEIVWPNNF